MAHIVALRSVLDSKKKEEQLDVFDDARKHIETGDARSFCILVENEDGQWQQWRYAERRYELVGVLTSAIKSILEED